MMDEADPRRKGEVSHSQNWFESQFSDIKNKGSDRSLTSFRSSQAFRHELYLSMLREYLSGQKPLRILDIGCAWGQFTAKLYHLNKSHCITGIDISKDAVEYDSKMYPQIEFLQRSLPDIGFEKNSFDMVILLEVLYYLDGENREKAIREIWTALVPGGHLLFSSALHNSKTYFSDAEAKRLIANHFHIKRVAYNHARFYTVFERPFLWAYGAIDILAHGEQRDGTLRSQSSPRKIFLARFSQIGIIRRLAMLLSPPITSLVISVFRNRTIARFFYWLDRTILGESGGSHVVILAQKPVDANLASQAENKP